MKKVINQEDLKNATDIEKCQILIAIIKGQAIYTYNSKTH